MSSPANVTTLQITMPPGHSAHCCDVDEPVDLVWSPDGQALAAGTEDSTIRVWTGSSTTPVYLNGDTNAIGGVAFSADGKHLLSGGTHVEIWDWAAASTLTYAADSKPSPPVFSPDGHTVAAAEPSGDAFLLSTHTLQKQRLGRGIPLAFSPEGDHLAVEGPGAVTVWDTVSQRQIAEFPIPNTNFATIPGYVYPWIEARFDRSGSVLAVLDKSALATTQVVRLMRWQWSAGLDATILTTTRRDQRFETLLSWGADDTVHFIEKGRDSVLKSWDGRQPPKVVATLPGEHGDIGRAAYLTPTKVLLDPGNRTQLWDLDTGTLNPVLPDYGSSQFALSGDGEMLAVSADYGTVNLWDLQPGNDPVRVGTYSVAPHIAVNHGGTLVVVADQAGTHLVPTKFAAKFPVVLELARGLVVRSLTADEEKQYLPSS
jgi:WD40 repeat protein